MNKYLFWAIPTLTLLLLTPFTPALDISIARAFYNPENISFTHSVWLKAIYHWGVIPGIATVAISIFILISSFFHTPWKVFRAPALSLILSLALGSGLIINVILKDHWNRPRPKQVVEFGGQQQYRPYYSPNFDTPPEPSKSFPSGHASMGFFFLSLCLVAKRHKSRVLFISGLTLTVILGSLLSMTRIAQGGHFFSDIVLAAFIMWYTALTIDWYLYDKIKLHRLN
ncbi:MAG: lipid A 4'-phosphatase [Chlamydiales bacterium]|jgi:lipid A 4'-phosphatase